ncbi:FAD binding domain-containing protein, partial [Acinetobacter baumannii]
RNAIVGAIVGAFVRSLGADAMNPFRYERADTVPAALALIQEAAERASGNASARCLAGGTNLVDLMKVDVMRPVALVDLGLLPLAEIEEQP